MLKVGKCIQVNVFGASPKPDRECKAKTTFYDGTKAIECIHVTYVTATKCCTVSQRNDKLCHKSTSGLLFTSQLLCFECF